MLNDVNLRQALSTSVLDDVNLRCLLRFLAASRCFVVIKQCTPANERSARDKGVFVRAACI